MDFLTQMDTLAYSYLTRIAIAVFALLIGFLLVKTIKALTFRVLGRLKIDATLLAFLKSLLGMSYYICMFILVLTIAGVPSTYFAGVLVGLGTAIGFGLKDEFKAISNGIIILITRPFKLGDIIQVNGYKGTVIDIQLFQTVLKTPENLNVVFNNGLITANGIVNLSDNGTVRQDIIISVSYDDDIAKVKNALKNIVEKSKFVLQTPEPVITVSEYSETSTKFLIRVWSNHLDTENAKFSVHEQIKTAFDNAHISIPYPKHDITIKRASSVDGA